MTLGPRESGVRLAFGVPKSGKSYSIACDVHASARAKMPVIVIDPMHEWHVVPPDLVKFTCRTHDVATAVAELGRGKRIAVVTAADTHTAVEQACQWVLSDPAAIQNGAALRGVAIHEAWMVARKGIPPGLSNVTRAWRHKCAAVWLDAQRVTMLPRDIVEIGTELRLFTAVGDRDFQLMREIGGKDLVRAVQECGARLAKKERGWFVSLHENRQGPFTPQRY